MSSEDIAPTTPIRREPPTFRRAAVRSIEHLSPRMRRFVLGGTELEGLEIDEPAASVRLLLPPPGRGSLVMPEWTGNQFELPDGERAPIRTFTPRRLDTGELALTLDIVVHDGGTASDWASTAAPGDEVAISGPGRGYEIDTHAGGYLLAGDETAVPAISQLLEVLPHTMSVRVHVEVAHPSARLELPAHPGADIRWHDLDPGARPGDALVDAVTGTADMPPSVWVAGEAASVQRIRKHLFDERGMTRSAATVRGYWKQGRSAT